jgi:hypothetical protein
VPRKHDNEQKQAVRNSDGQQVSPVKAHDVRFVAHRDLFGQVKW